ncbi:hypothetical protein IG631_22658 [Alternaria alternata]|nr:hypothetical protein IG631_22658 [Alternaria alternata]
MRATRQAYFFTRPEGGGVLLNGHSRGSGRFCSGPRKVDMDSAWQTRSKRAFMRYGLPPTAVVPLP